MVVDCLGLLLPMNARNKMGFWIERSLTRECKIPKSTYISNPKKSLHEIVIYALQIEQGEIHLPSDFKGGWKRLPYFTNSGISGRIPYIKSR
jgi:hypothetical protein